MTKAVAVKTLSGEIIQRPLMETPWRFCVHIIIHFFPVDLMKEKKTKNPLFSYLYSVAFELWNINTSTFKLPEVCTKTLLWENG